MMNNPFKEVEDLIAQLEESKRNGHNVTREEMTTLEEMILMPKWDCFKGYNRISIPNFKLIAGGEIRFKEHLHRPLSNKLWEDLMLRLQIKQLCLYSYNDLIPCGTSYSPAVCIYLDENENVADISYNQPYINI